MYFTCCLRSYTCRGKHHRTSRARRNRSVRELLHKPVENYLTCLSRLHQRNISPQGLVYIPCVLWQLLREELWTIQDNAILWLESHEANNVDSLRVRITSSLISYFPFVQYLNESVKTFPSEIRVIQLYLASWWGSWLILTINLASHVIKDPATVY